MFASIRFEYLDTEIIIAIRWFSKILIERYHGEFMYTNNIYWVLILTFSRRVKHYCLRFEFAKCITICIVPKKHFFQVIYRHWTSWLSLVVGSWLYIDFVTTMTRLLMIRSLHKRNCYDTLHTTCRNIFIRDFLLILKKKL